MLPRASFGRARHNSEENEGGGREGGAASNKIELVLMPEMGGGRASGGRGRTTAKKAMARMRRAERTAFPP